jgi:hypothetical protein
MDASAWLSAPSELIAAFDTIANFFKSPLALKLREEMEVVSKLHICKSIALTGISQYTPILGKLSLKTEAAGKIRVFAIVDVWTQSILEPIHEYIYSILRNIPQDGTFDQSRPLTTLRGKIDGKSKTYSYDLSAATDRLPLALQVQVLASFLVNEEVARAWGVLLSGRDF